MVFYVLTRVLCLTIVQVASCLEGESLVDFPLQPVEYDGQLRQVQDLLRNRSDKIAKAFVKDHTMHTSFA
eukprot:m.1118264 g.1118264  ORF g.1118264 m.1118264 type:complete len:70 (+) comp24383_c0_seq1:80-289(+)